MDDKSIKVDDVEYVPFTLKEKEKYEGKPCLKCGVIGSIKKYKLPSQHVHYAKIGCIECRSFLQFGQKPKDLKIENSMKLSEEQRGYLEWCMKKTGHDPEMYNLEGMTLQSGTAILRLLKSWLNAFTEAKAKGEMGMDKEEIMDELDNMRG